MAESNIFISYAHEDTEWARRISVHLRPLQRQGVAVWHDAPILAGEDWSKQLQEAISDADLVILLISADFLASDFVYNAEIPRLLDRQREGHLLIVPVIVRACAWHHVDWLARLQVLPRGGEPLASHENLDSAIVEVVRRIAELTEIISANKKSSAEVPVRNDQPPPPKPKPAKEQKDTAKPYVFISHENDDGYFAEVLKLKLEKEELDAWIDVDRLRVGDDWLQEIDDAIRNAVAVTSVGVYHRIY